VTAGVNSLTSAVVQKVMFDAGATLVKVIAGVSIANFAVCLLRHGPKLSEMVKECVSFTRFCADDEYIRYHEPVYFHLAKGTVDFGRFHVHTAVLHYLNAAQELRNKLEHKAALVITSFLRAKLDTGKSFVNTLGTTSLKGAAFLCGKQAGKGVVVKYAGKNAGYYFARFVGSAGVVGLTLHLVSEVNAIGKHGFSARLPNIVGKAAGGAAGLALVAGLGAGGLPMLLVPELTSFLGDTLANAAKA